MSAPRKKRRLSPDLHTAVLSVFHHTPDEPYPPKYTNLPTSLLHASSRLTSLCESLICISKEGGHAALLSLQTELRDRFYSSAELLASLHADDDDEAVAPLCATLALLRARNLRACDLLPEVVVRRAVYELLRPEACSCRGVQAGLKGLIKELVSEGGPGCEEILDAFVSVLFWGSRGSAIDAGKTFKLTEVALRVLREVEGGVEMQVGRFYNWLRRAVMPTGVARETASDKGLVVRTCCYCVFASASRSHHAAFIF